MSGVSRGPEDPTTPYDKKQMGPVDPGAQDPWPSHPVDGPCIYLLSGA
jgi:hypothetical protein